MLIYLQMIETPDERSKFEQIYLEYRDTMYAVAYKILHNESDAEDAVHQAFVKVAENIQKINEAKCPKTKSFVVTIVENRAIDVYRRKNRHPSVPFNETHVGIAVEPAGTDGLAACIARLPARYRQVILLKYRHGYSIKEIAQILGISLSNASKLEQRAKAKLEQLCKEAQIL